MSLGLIYNQLTSLRKCFLFIFFSSDAFSYVRRGGPSGKSSGRKPRTWRVWRLCVYGSVSWARQNGQTASHIPPRHIYRVSHLPEKMKGWQLVQLPQITQTIIAFYNCSTKAGKKMMHFIARYRSLFSDFLFFPSNYSPSLPRVGNASG